MLREHTDRVTGLVAYGSTIGSVSWDLSIRLWDLDQASATCATARSPSRRTSSSTRTTITSSRWRIRRSSRRSRPRRPTRASSCGISTRRSSRTEGEASADGTRSLSVPEGRKGKALCGTLKGHAADVSHVKWNPVHGLWVTGSEDHTVRCWTPTACVQVRDPTAGHAVTGHRRMVLFWGEYATSLPRVAGDAERQHNGNAVASCSQYLTASMDDTRMRVYDVETRGGGGWWKD